MRAYLNTLYRGGLIVVAGPCSAESEEQVIATATALSSTGVRVFRAGLWKPRTSPGGFDGVGEQGLPWLQCIKRETGMLVSTEVGTARHVEQALASGIDILWVGARTAGDPFAIQQIADALRGTDAPVLLKNPASPDLELWVGGLRRLLDCGVRRVGAIHRGFTPSTDQSVYRNSPRWDIAIELKRRFPELCILCDPSHIAGDSHLVAEVAHKSVAMGFDGLFVESHCAPGAALSDAGQQLSPDAFRAMLAGLEVRPNSPGVTLEQLRQRIDECDDELIGLLSRRMAIVREIGQFKAAHRVPAIQVSRFERVLRRMVDMGRDRGLSPSFIAAVMTAIHEEAVHQQV